MASQLICLLMLGLVVAHVLALYLNRPDDTLHPLSRRYMLDTQVSAFRIAEQASADTQKSLLDTQLRKGYTLAVDTQPLVTAATYTDDELIVVRELQRRLPHVSDIRAHIIVNHENKIGSLGRLELQTSLQLADGSWLNTQEMTGNKSPWWRPLGFSVPVSTLPVLIIVFIFVRRILRPIKALASAAERMSRGEHVGPLPVTGPREARELTVAFNVMEERLRRYIDERTRMLAALSHDFRTPLTSLRLRTELVDDPELRMGMRRSLEDMSAMAEETLRFSRDDSINEETEELDLVELVNAVLDEHVSVKERIQLHAPDNLLYRGRRLALKRVLTNLVDNALRFGERVYIDAKLTNNHDIRIDISDDGPGIPAEKLAEAFEPFVRLDPARHRKIGGGTGLGLTIARSYVEKHGGTLTIFNREPKGLQATILLPA